ncbi:MAG: hypothetical protein QXI84_09395 [Thermofilaceae archaeon]
MRPQLLGFEVNIPAATREVVISQLVEGLNAGDKGLQVLLVGAGQGERVDLLGVLEDGRLIWVEVKNLDRLPSYPPPPNDVNYNALRREYVRVSERAEALISFLKNAEGVRGSPERASAVLASLVLAFSGAGPSGCETRCVSSVFVMPPVYKFPKVSGAIERTPVVFVSAFFREGRLVIYSAEFTLGELTDAARLGEFFDGFVKSFGSVKKASVVEDLQNIAEAYLSKVAGR